MNNPEHVFIEDIIYCPSQIYYYFSVPNGKSEDQDDRQYVAYVRQRGGPLTFELIEVDKETGEWMWDFDDLDKNIVHLSRIYDINNQPTQEAEEMEIMKLEEEVMWYLRQQFPNITFPTQPERRKRV